MIVGSDGGSSDGVGRDGGGPDGSGGRSLSVAHVVVTESFAGVERYVCQVSNELSARGHRVVTLGGDPRRMRSELDRSVVNLPAPSLVRAARSLARQRDVDVVHVHMTAAEGAAWLARRLPARRRGVAPIVATRHFARDRGSSGPARALARMTSRAVACDIAISRFVADTVSGPTVLIPNGVADRPPAALEAKTVLMLQRLDREKAPEVGVRAWAASGLAAEGWQLVVAGAGELSSELTRLAAQLGVVDSVSLVGHVADTDLALDRSSVLLAPAPAEPFGLSVVEAMAHGLPVVAADGGAHPETLGTDGMLFTPGRADQAAAALVSLAHDPALRRTVGARLRRRQQEQFSLGGHVDRLEAVYLRVGEASGSRRA
jgi:glycosyltransferase involved in cell wall biosynthesis